MFVELKCSLCVKDVLTYWNKGLQRSCNLNITRGITGVLPTTTPPPRASCGSARSIAVIGSKNRIDDSASKSGQAVSLTFEMNSYFARDRVWLKSQDTGIYNHKHGKGHCPEQLL